ncbi:hypothetical protein QBC43DRAFT_344272 [Cladorrhinum sp. PSN259]|nr:hypothetical protein QBC43DRAFT_344272 [Cladorrhinum sp. PSN259]
MDPSTAVSASSRNDDTIVSNIISLLTSDPYEDMDDASSESKAWKERFIARARLALSDATIDRDDLLQRYRYLADVRNRSAGIVNMATIKEGTAKQDHERHLQKHFKVTGSSANAASEKIKSFLNWYLLKGSQATDCWDRIRHLAARLGISRQKLIDAIHPYSDRNTALHCPPPKIVENLIEDGKIDWDSIRKQCEEKKTSLDTDVLDVQERHAKMAKSLLSPLPSFYSDGKWDDIDL